MIEVEQYREAQKALQNGSREVFAHGVGWPEDDWQQLLWVLASRGEWFGRFYPLKDPNSWTQIDGLRIGK